MRPLAGEGWVYSTRDVSLDGADSVVAYAVVYDVNGNTRMTTQRSALSIGEHLIGHAEFVEACSFKKKILQKGKLSH